VLRFCRAELLQHNYFHAVLEASKSVADKLRTKTGEDGDGSPLVDATCSLKSGPRIAFNDIVAFRADRHSHAAERHVFDFPKSDGPRP
jgi:uncharacterized protein (TIGR02391 family)